MDKVLDFLKSPAAKVILVSVATIVKVYTPDNIDKMIDDALLIFVGYNALTNNNTSNNA